MKSTCAVILSAFGLFIITGCGESPNEPAGAGAPASTSGADTHVHDDGTTHDDHAEEAPAEDQAHDETSIGTVDEPRLTLAE